MKKTMLKACVLLSLAVLFSSYAWTEVSVEVNDFGNYLKTNYVEKQTGKILKIWTKFGNKPNIYALNEYGDVSGDLKPAIRENPAQGNFPHVLWAKSDGHDYEIVFSKWTKAGWADITFIETVDNPYDDLDPSLDFDSGGRPYISWWRDINGAGAVFISVFLKTRWMEAYQISDAGVDSWDPEVRIDENGDMEVTYSTSSGLQVKIVTFRFPDTITDDIDPFGTNLIAVQNGNNGSLGN